MWPVLSCSIMVAGIIYLLVNFKYLNQKELWRNILSLVNNHIPMKWVALRSKILLLTNRAFLNSLNIIIEKCFWCHRELTLLLNFLHSMLAPYYYIACVYIPMWHQMEHFVKGFFGKTIFPPRLMNFKCKRLWSKSIVLKYIP